MYRSLSLPAPVSNATPPPPFSCPFTSPFRPRRQGLRKDLFGTIFAFGGTLLTGVLGWFVALPLLIAATYAVSLPPAKLLTKRMQGPDVAPDQHER